MSPKDKANELVEKFYTATRITIAGAASIIRNNAPKLAFIAVEEILQVIGDEIYFKETRDYWLEVRSEIEKIKT